MILLYETRIYGGEAGIIEIPRLLLLFVNDPSDPQ